MKYAKVTLGTIAVITYLLGCEWILQGVNILPGNFVTGDVRWSYSRGAVLAAIGVALFMMSRRKRQQAVTYIEIGRKPRRQEKPARCTGWRLWMGAASIVMREIQIGPNLNFILPDA
jgi:hypothetical protein